MVTETEFRDAYSELKVNIIPIIDEFNNRKNSSKWANMLNRVEKSRYAENVSLEKAIASLGISELVNHLHKSEFYSLVIEHIKSIEHCTLKKPFLMKDMYDGSIIAYIESEGVDSVFSIGVYKTDHIGTHFTLYSISIMEGECDKITLLGFSEIMEQIKSIENS